MSSSTPNLYCRHGIQETMMKTFISRFVISENSAGFFEYGLVAAGVAVVIAAAIHAIGTSLI